MLAATTLVKVHNLAGKNAMILVGYMAIPSYSLAHLCATCVPHTSCTTFIHALLLVSNTHIQITNRIASLSPKVRSPPLFPRSVKKAGLWSESVTEAKFTHLQYFLFLECSGILQERDIILH